MHHADSENDIDLEGFEMIPLAVIQSDGGTLRISGVNAAINLKTLYELSYPPAKSGDVVNIYIDAGADNGSTGAAVPSISTGVWATGVIINLVNNSNNNFGAGGNGSGPGGGQRGGTALKVQHQINLTNYGSFSGGGGGGAGTDPYTNGSGTWQAGGGGGAGKPPGAGWVVVGGTITSDGADGTTTTGGSGGNFGAAGDQPSQGGTWGGDGGALGLQGLNGGDTSQPGSEDNIGGAAGYSIDGVSLVNFIVMGTLVGPTNP